MISHIKAGRNQHAIELLRVCKEPNETHLGLSMGVSRGTALGEQSSLDVWSALTESAAVVSGLVQDLEDTILLIPGISEDRVSDITTNIIRSELITYTQGVCSVLNIPTQSVASGPIWNFTKKEWNSTYSQLPCPEDWKLILVPKSIVRKSMHFDVDTYYRYSILEHYRGIELNANTSLVNVLKNREKRVYIKDLKEKYPNGKENIQKYTAENPKLLVEFRKERRMALPGPMDNFELSESLKISPPQFQELISEIRAISPGKEGAAQYETVIEKYFWFNHFFCVI